MKSSQIHHAQRKHILDIPGTEEDPSSEYMEFVNQMHSLIGFKPGFHIYSGEFGRYLLFPSVKFYYGHGNFVNTEFGELQFDGRWLFKLIDEETLENFEKLLELHNVMYIKNTCAYQMCCTETTENSRSTFLFNFLHEPILVVSVPTELYLANISAYVDKFTQEDERLEKAIVQKWTREYEQTEDLLFPPPGVEIFASKQEGETYIEKFIYEELKTCTTGSHPTRYAYLSGKPKYRWPKTATDAELNSNSVTKLCMLVPQIARVYSDGSALVAADETIAAPLESAFSKYHGIEQYTVPACSTCWGKDGKEIKHTTRKNAIEDAKKDMFFPFTNDVAQKIGYSFDFERIKTRVLKRIPIHPYSSQA